MQNGGLLMQKQVPIFYFIMFWIVEKSDLMFFLQQDYFVCVWKYSSIFVDLQVQGEVSDKNYESSHQLFCYQLWVCCWNESRQLAAHQLYPEVWQGPFSLFFRVLITTKPVKGLAGGSLKRPSADMKADPSVSEDNAVNTTPLWMSTIKAMWLQR